MFPPILNIPACQRAIQHHKQVLCVLLLLGAGEIETSANDGFPVNDHDLIVHNRMGWVYHGGDSGMGQKVGLAILLPSLAFVQDDLDPYRFFMGIE